MLSGSLSLVIFLLLWFLRAHWRSYIFPDSASDAVIGFGLALGWVNVLCTVANHILSGLQQFREVTIVGTLQIVLTGVFSVALGCLFGASGAVCGYFLANAFFVAFAFQRVKRVFPELFTRPKWPGVGEFRSILSFAFPLWLWALSSGPLITLSFAFLAGLPEGTRHLGVFNTANAMKMTIGLLPALLGNVLYPAILEQGGRYGTEAELSRLIRKSYVALAFLALPPLILMLFASDLIFLIYGRRYSGAGALFIPLAASAALNTFCQPALSLMVARNRTWWNLLGGVFQQCTLYGLVRIWCPVHFGNGLAWAFLVSQAAFMLLHLEFAVRIVKLPAIFRLANYAFIAAVGFFLLIALVLPAAWRWGLALPASASVGWLMLRRHRDIEGWIGSAIPSRLRPSWLMICRNVLARSPTARTC